MLTDVAVKGAKPDAKQRKLFDGGGLYLLVTPKGGKYWRLKYRHAGLEKSLSLGVYPEISLRRAREKCAEARALLEQRIDPSEFRKLRNQVGGAAGEHTLSAIAEEWFAHYQEHKKHEGAALSPATVAKTQWLLNLVGYQAKKNATDGPHPLNALSRQAIQSITKDDIASVIHGLKNRGRIETAHRMLSRLDQVFRYAVGTGRLQTNPVAVFRDSADPRDKLPAIVAKNHPALTDPRDVSELLRAIYSYSGQPTTEAALKLAPYLFVRPGELRAAKWSEMDLESSEPVWRIPAERTKTRREHIVPLASQAVEILTGLHVFTGANELVFPALTSAKRPLSENAVTAALRRMGYSGQQMT